MLYVQFYGSSEYTRFMKIQKHGRYILYIPAHYNPLSVGFRQAVKLNVFIVIFVTRQVISNPRPTNVPYTDYTCTSCTKCLDPIQDTLQITEAHEARRMLTKVHTCTGGTQRIRINTKVLPRKFEHVYNRGIQQRKETSFSL